MEEKIYQLLDLIKKSGDACPDYERIKELTPKILLNPKDIDDFLYALSDCEYDVTALEAVLRTADCWLRLLIYKCKHISTEFGTYVLEYKMSKNK